MLMTPDGSDHNNNISGDDQKKNVENNRKNDDEIPQSDISQVASESKIKTVRVDNISMVARIEDIREFFSFSGDIRYVEMKKESETNQYAFVTFKEPQGVETAVLLSGATIADRCVTIKAVDDYKLPPEAQVPPSPKKPIVSEETIRKAEDVVSSMIAKGYVLGKDAINKAKELDQRHQWTSNASAKVASIDQKMGLSEKLIVGTAVMNDKVREMDEKYQVSEKTKSAIAIAEQTASNVGSTIMSNRYVSAGASWVSNAIGAVSKTAEEVGNMTKEKVEKAEEDKRQEAVLVAPNDAVVDTSKASLSSAPASAPAPAPAPSHEASAAPVAPSEPSNDKKSPAT